MPFLGGLPFIYVLKMEDSIRPEEDWFGEDIDRAKEICRIKWGVPPNSWKVFDGYRDIHWMTEMIDEIESDSSHGLDLGPR
jgi:hypothetical protein